MDGKRKDLTEEDVLKKLMLFGTDTSSLSQITPFSGLVPQGVTNILSFQPHLMPGLSNFPNMLSQDQIFNFPIRMKSNMPSLQQYQKLINDPRKNPMNFATSLQQYQKLMNDPLKNPMSIATCYTRNLVLNTDEPLEIVAEKTKKETCENLISFYIKPLYDKLKLKNSVELPCTVTLKGGMADMEVIEKNRQGLDLIFVVDISFSMRSGKIELVQKTMEFVITLLKDFDRVSIIGFNNSAYIYCPLTVMNDQGKGEISDIIKKMGPNGRTNVECGVRAALHMLADRKVCNQVSSILFLGDGGDDYKKTINKRVKVAIEEFKPKIKSSFRMHTFGYGKNHDSFMMNLMAELTNGNFYYIENEATVADAFANCMGELIALLASNIQVSLTTKDCGVPFKLTKVYSNTGDTVFTMPNVFFDDKKDSVFVLDFEAVQENFVGRKIVPIEAVATFTLKNGEKTKKTAVLEVFIAENDEDVKKDEKILLEYYRVKGAESLKQVMKLADTGKFAEAREVAKVSEEEISRSDVANNPKIQALIKDIRDSQKRTESKISWNSGGRAQVTSIQNSHFNKIAMSNCMQYQNNVQSAYSMNFMDFVKRQTNPPNIDEINLDNNKCENKTLTIIKTDNKRQRPKESEQIAPDEPAPNKTTISEIEALLKSHSNSSVSFIQQLKAYFLTSPDPKELITQAIRIIFEIIENEPTKLNWGKFCIDLLFSVCSEPKIQQIQTFFLPNPESENELINQLSKAQKTMLICVFSLTNCNIIKAIRNAKSRGVDIKIIFNNEDASSPNSIAKKIYIEGYDIRVALDQDLYMNHKFVVLDSEIVITGSHNWTCKESAESYQNVLMIEDKEIAKKFVKEFDKLWSKFTRRVDMSLGEIDSEGI